MNGHLLTLDSLLSPGKKKQFLDVLRLKQKKNIADYKHEILQDLKNGEIEKSDYEFALSLIEEDCWDNYDAKNFKLYPGQIEILIDCNFPHVRQNMDPSPSLFFSLVNFKQYVRAKYKNL